MIYPLEFPVKAFNFFRRSYFSLPYPNSSVESFIPRRVRLSTPVKISHSVLFSCDGDCLLLNSYSSIGAYSHLGSSLVSIGKYCSIAPFCFIAPISHNLSAISTSSALNSNWLTRNISENHVNSSTACHNIRKSSTIIHNDVWIGVNVFIRDGVTIHNGAVIGANSVVLENVPPYAVVAGAPAKIVNYRFSKAIIRQLLDIIDWESNNCTPDYLHEVSRSIILLNS
jgi:acetyltransferase-like isoleucine patch superfamily enzyme